MIVVTRIALRTLSAAFLAAALPVHADAPCPGTVYGKGARAICLPMGAASFADEVVSFERSARPAEPTWDAPEQALGEPDYTRPSAPGYVSLGCHGVLVLRFVDNVLVDVDGLDLYVFEVGPMVEATDLEISADGSQWLPVGRIEGARSEVDIAGVATPGTGYPFVRLTNAGKACGGRSPGADIDAVAAVGSALRLSLDSAVLFDSGQSALKAQAHAALEELAGRLRSHGRGTRITIEGHTDSVGSDADNLALSLARAHAVRAFLLERIELPASQVEIAGHGESRPVASNDDEAGRARNRRVDLLVRPGG